jgi:hypothetical protein
MLLADWSETPEEELLSNETRRTVRRMIASLPDPYRVVLLLRDLERLSTEETAEILGESVASVKSRLHRARMALREQVTRSLAPECVLREARAARGSEEAVRPRSDQPEALEEGRRRSRLALHAPGRAPRNIRARGPDDARPPWSAAPGSAGIEERQQDVPLRRSYGRKSHRIVAHPKRSWSAHRGRPANHEVGRQDGCCLWATLLAADRDGPSP